MKKVLIFLVGGVLLYLVVNGLVNSYYAEKGRQILQYRQVLLEDWYQKNNPSHDSAGKQPTEEDMRQIRIESRKGI